MDQVCSFFLGDLITCLAKTAIVPNGPEVILYGTAGGALGAFYPFERKEDHDFFMHLELNMRAVHPPLLGR
jgi:splicing factor 3B subunit 3